MRSDNHATLQDFVTDMRIAKLSPETIGDRLRLVRRFAEQLDKALLEADGDDLRAYQARFAHLSPASVNVYSRHLKAFFDWAARRRHITTNPAADLVIASVPKGMPHPASVDDLRVIFACTDGSLRMAYVLAAFTGLRRGEICRLQRADLDLAPGNATALIHGKGRRERRVPLIEPVIAELHEYGLARRGAIVTRNDQPYPPETLSIDSHYHLRELGLETTLHSLRHTFATTAGQTTRDPLFVRDLLGHGSVATTEIYMLSSLNGAHGRLAGVTALAESFVIGRSRATLTA